MANITQEMIEKIKIIHKMFCYGVAEDVEVITTVNDIDRIISTYYDIIKKIPNAEELPAKALLKCIDSCLSTRYRGIRLFFMDELVNTFPSLDGLHAVNEQVLFRAVKLEILNSFKITRSNFLTISMSLFEDFGLDIFKDTPVCMGLYGITVKCNKKTLKTIISRIVNQQKGSDKLAYSKELIYLGNASEVYYDGAVWRKNDNSVAVLSSFRKMTKEDEKARTKLALDLWTRKGCNRERTEDSVLTLKNSLNDISNSFIAKARKIKEKIRVIRNTPMPDLQSEMELIEKIPEVKEIKITEDEITFRIAPGEIRHTSPKRLLSGLEKIWKGPVSLPEYIIRIRPDWDVTEMKRNIHPHIASDGTICYGRAADDITKAKINNDIYFIVAKTVELLQSYNWNGAYHTKHLIREPHIWCEDCGLLTIGCKCSNCNNTCYKG